MAAEITRHGGKIEKYIGDAIMAVFGLPRAHEDDALRAVRAAAGMQEALRRVNDDLRARYGVALANRTGVNTGEVVANDDPTADQKLATGDAVNVAARLEQAAPENQIYLGESTYRLVRDAVEVEAVEPLELKGKAQRVPAFRLGQRARAGRQRAAPRPPDRRPRRRAGGARPSCYREVVADRAASRTGHADRRRRRRQVAPGARGDRRGSPRGARVRRAAAACRTATASRSGRCAMMVREAAGIRDDDTPEAAQAKLLERVGDPEVAAAPGRRRPA